MQYLLVFVGFLVTFILTYFVRQFALKKNIMDTPNERSSHSVPTPRGGGVAIAVTWYIAIVLLTLAGKLEVKLAAALFSGIFLSIVSLIDDVLGLSPRLRLIVQIVTTLAGMYFLGGLQQFGGGTPHLAIQVLTQLLLFFGILWMINVFNFLDGTDGYLGSEGLFIFLSFFILTLDFNALLFAAIILGFLLWNWPKAKIFCGDIGSTLIGYTMAIFAVYYQNAGELSLVIPIILSALFWFDATVTLIRRWRNKEKISIAHKKHAYQRLNQSGFSHLKVLGMGWLINLLLFILAFFSHFYSKYAFLMILMQILLMSLFMVFVERRKRFEL